MEEKNSELVSSENSLKERISKVDEDNQKLCKYLEKLKEYVERTNLNCTESLKMLNVKKEQLKTRDEELKTVQELVQQRFNVDIFFKDGQVMIE